MSSLNLCIKYVNKVKVIVKLTIHCTQLESNKFFKEKFFKERRRSLLIAELAAVQVQ